MLHVGGSTIKQVIGNNMRTLTLILLLLVSSITVTNDADARRRRSAPPPVEEPVPHPRCFDQESQLWLDCITNQPVDQPETETPGVVVDTTEDSLTRPVPPPLPLDLNRYTLEQFNDSRVSVLHNQVRLLVAEAVENARRPFDRENLTAEIQIRLDRLADGADPNRVIDRYWIEHFPDRSIVFVKPMRNLHIIRYTILTGER